MAYNVVTSDVEARWRPLSDAERGVAITLIEDAEVLLGALRPKLAAAVTAGSVPLRLVTAVITEAVRRVLANPDRLREQRVEGDGGVLVGHGAESTGPRLVITPDDLRAVDAALAPRSHARSKLMVVA